MHDICQISYTVNLDRYTLESLFHSVYVDLVRHGDLFTNTIT